MIRICIVSPFPPPHGGIAQWANIIHDSIQHTDEISLIQINTTPYWRDVDDFSIWKRMIGGAIQLCKDYFVFLKSLLKQPHVIHLASSASLAVIRDLIICSTAKLLQIPVVYHLHFGRVPQIANTNTLEWRILALNLRLASVVISITPQTFETIVRYLPNTRVEYIPNPVCSFHEIQPVKIIPIKNQILFLGWVIPTKGISELVQVWSEINSKDWELLIVGPGKVAYQTELINQYKPSNIKFVGEVQHIQAMQLVIQSDIFVLPSHTEGFPNVILEAMICGKPIIATSVGAIPDMLSPNCGLLIETQDVEGLKQALIKLMENEALRNDLGARAREKALQNYSIDVVSNKYVNLWRRMISKKN
jgi:glycosyltransferase involved in cell wall biosynthesis